MKLAANMQKSWGKIIFLSAIMLTVVSLAQPAFSANRDRVVGNMMLINDNGGWTWYTDEKIFYDPIAGNVLASTAGEDNGFGGVGGTRLNDIDATTFNIDTGKRTRVVHRDGLTGSGDDHSIGAFWMRPDGRYMHFMCPHYSAQTTYYRLATNPHDGNSWGPEQSYNWLTIPGSPGSDTLTSSYTNICYLTGEGTGMGRLYNMHRVFERTPCLAYSDDLGQTWQYMGRINGITGTTTYSNFYHKIADNGVDRIDFIGTEQHPRNYNNSIYHGYIKNGKSYNSYGVEIDTINDQTAPSIQAFTPVFTAGTPAAGVYHTAWTNELELDKNGFPVCLFQTRYGTTPWGDGSGQANIGAYDHRFFYGRFNGTSWTTTELCKIGTGMHAPEQDYIGMGCINPDDANVVYVSTNFDPVTDVNIGKREIFKGVTPDNGVTWDWTQITINSTVDNIRPAIPRQWDANNTAVFWTRGAYPGQENYDFVLVGMVEEEGVTPGLVSYTDASTSNTTNSDGSAFSPTGPSSSAGTADSRWHQYTVYGNGGSCFTAGDGGTENVPTIKTTVTGLADGTYDVFAYFWCDPNLDWGIRGGFSSSDMLCFNKQASQWAEASQFSGSVTVTGTGGVQLYRIYIGRQVVSGGTPVVVYLDNYDSTYTTNIPTRTTYDGVGVAVVDYEEDLTPPTPNPMTWASLPAAISSSAITMMATTATDANYPPVQYYFECTTDGSKSSGWQISPTYVAASLTAGTQYTFRVKARDSAPINNETGLSVNASAVTSPAPVMPTFVAAGAITSNALAITPALPAGIATGDILLLFLETSNQAITIPTPNGGTWTAVTNSPQSTGTSAGATGARLTVFWSRYNGTQGAPTTSDSGDHQMGLIAAFRGVVASGNPWDVTAGGVEAVADTTGSIPGATTTIINDLIVAAIAAALPDSDITTNFSAWANTNLTSVTERTDNTTSQGNGGGLGIATGGRAATGAYGSTTVTLGTAAYKGMMSIALKPAPGSGTPPGLASSPSPATGATGVSTTTTLSWTAGSGAVVHDVYFGTDSTPDETEFKGSQAGTTYNPGTLLNNTTYYWRIDEKNNGGTTTGTIWNFTTVTGGSVSVPNVVGMTEAAAGSTITGAGLVVGTVTYQYSNTVPAGNVISQAPSAGTMVSVGSSVNLVVSLGQPQVPGVVGQTLAAATTAITSVDSLTVSSTTAYSDTVAVGLVISQNPASGTFVNIGSNVALVVSLGQPQVPGVVGQTLAAATTAITSVDSLTVSSTTAYSDTVAVGLVISQNPASGTFVNIGSNVALVVSLGQPQVPGVVGQTLAAATTAITSVDSLTVSSTTAYSDTVAVGLVISQNPASGTFVNIGSNVALVVSLGQPQVPGVVGQTLAAATTAITSVDSLTVSSTTAYSDTVAVGLVISQNPASGTFVNIGSNVALVVSLGQPQVPGVVGQTLAAATTAITSVDSLTVSSTTAYSDTVAVGLVISQNPASGTFVNIGSNVALVVSLGQPQVPGVVGQTLAAATTAITSVDSLTVSSTTAYSDTVAVGLVISQNPASGTFVNIGSNVALVVSLGQPQVPGVVGQTLAAATTAITSVDSLTVSSTTAYSDTVAVGLVISQNPASGTFVNIGSNVALVVSLGQPQVPGVVGQTLAAATTAITSVDSLTVSSTTAYSDTVAVGLVISQNPASGTFVNIGSNVALVVSLGQPQVPGVVGQTLAAATTAITSVDSLTVSSTTAYSDTVAVGLVISQNPASGTFVNIGSNVALVVSLGQPQVPGVVGQTLAAATTAITSVDSLTVSSTTAYSDTVAVGLVISQNPASGTFVNIGSNVALVVSLGQPQVPGVVGQTLAAATTAITSVDSLTVSSTTAYSDTVAVGLVISQNPASGTFVNIGSNVALVVSLGQPQVPGVVGQTLAAATTAITSVDSLTVSSTTAYSDTVAVGLVISQNPASGTFVNIGSNVALVVSLGQPQVPGVVGQTLAAATTAITSVDSLTVSSTTAYSDTVAVGLVISQNPASGTFVNIGSNVALVVSLGQPQVPGVVGQTLAAATTAITSVDSLTVSSTTAYSDTVAVGLVISQNPASGTFVNIGSNVALVVSLGQPQVPGVVGQTLAAATTAITSVDSLTVSSTTAYSDTVAVGLVISQNPASGTFVNIGSNVALVVSLGQPQVPGVVGQTLAAATTAITSVDSLTVSSTTAYSDTVAVGLVISQNPASGTFVNIGSNVALVVSLGQPQVPGVVGQTLAAATTAITSVDSLTVSSTTAYSDTVAVGLVISQNPASGTFVNIGSNVALVVSLGQPQVPGVVGQTLAAATTAITSVDSLTVSSTTAYSDTVAVGLVISQNPASGTFVNIGSNVALVVSLGQPQVPGVVGQTLAAATTAITSVDSLTVSSTTAYSDTVAVGLVISQNPASGTFVNIGSNVALVVSLGQPQVPGVVGQTLAAATTAITSVDSLTVSSTTAYSDTVAVGLVISQNPASGTFVNIGSNVALVVSLGQPQVPDVVGMTQAAATTAITAVDSLTVGTVTQQCSDTVTAGNVISQNPAGGTQVDTGTSVDLVVSTGQPTVPDVTGMTQAEAIADINAVANISYGSSTTACSDTVPAGSVISQSVTGTVPCGTIVNLVVSTGQFPKDDFNDNRRGSMWRISVSDPNTMVIEDISRLNITSIGDNDLAAPCVGYWKMNDNAANTTVIDSSGKGNNGTAQQNTSSLHTGSGNPPNLNGALTFNGTSDYVNVGSAIGTGAYTKVAWVKRTGGVQNNIISSSTWSHVLWAPSEQSFKLSAGHNSSLFLVQDSVAMQTNTWYFVAVTFDPNVASGRMVLYKNGTKVDDANNVPTQIAGTTYIGRFLTGYGFTGSIDNVLIFNRALSQDEITYLYSNGAGTETIPSGGGYGTASYTANGWSFDVVQDFEVKADYHYSDQSTMDGRVMMVLEYNDGNYVELSAGFDGSQAYLYYETVVDSNIVSSNEVARASNDGTLYVSYNAGLDELYLSFTGFGDANEWQTVTGLLAGQWSSDPVRVLIGGSSDGAAIRMGEAYLEDFKVDSGLILGWLPVSDIDGNGFIEWDDLKIMCDNWLDVGLDIPGNIFEDEDDIVNFLDFAEFGLAW